MRFVSGSVLSFLLASFTLTATPQTPVVIAGDASFETHHPELLEIIANHQSIIEWEDFSIERGETVRFIQPDPMACVLNQVREAYPSRLMGNLESNGQVLLINPHGILVGKEARIDTGSFFASTLPLQIDSFKDQTAFTFEGTTGKVRVEGTIHARRVALIGTEVEQAGQLMGLEAATLSSGRKVTLSLDAEVQSMDPFLGRTQVTGSLLAPQGKISLFGEQIRIEEKALLDVCSGTISVGGKGLAPSQWTLISDSAIVRADAGEMGDGGRVVIWSEEGTISHGFLSAKGGRDGGNGGFVEVSGKKQLDFNWNADLSAEKGSAGTLLLDPTNVIIRNAGPFTGGVVFGSPTTWPALTNPVVINNANVAGGLSFFLNNSGNVVISTTVVPDPGAAGTITVNSGSNVSWTSGNSLTLIADSDLIVNSNIQNSSTGNVTLTSLNGNIFINNSANVQAVSVGTRAGTTTVNANGRTPPAGCNSCANLVNTPPFGANASCCTFCNAPVTGTGNICIHATNAAIGQIGRAAGAIGELCTGAINVDCNNLSLITGLGNGCSAIIGHGGTNSSTNSGNITVNAAGNIFLLAQGPSSNSTPVIGHATPTTSTNQAGNITVNAGQDLILKCTGSTVDACLIGHTDLFTDVGAFVVSGNITVRVGRDIWLDSSQNVNVMRLGIGHSFFPSQNLTGNIDVFAGRNINMIGSTVSGGNTMAYIGLCSFVTGRNITSNIHVEACNDINLDPRRSTSFGIGAQNTVTGTVNGTITVLSGHNINIMPTLALGSGILTTYIGYNPTGAVAVNTTTTVIAANDITLGGGGGTRGAGIGGQGEVIVHAGEDIILNAATGRVYIGSDDTVDSHGTVLISGRDMRASSVGANVASFGRDSALAVGAHPLTMLAAGDIQFTRGYTTNGAASILIEADTDLVDGELWGAGVFTCPGLIGASAAANADGIGAIRKAATAPILAFQTVNGNITLRSASMARSGAAQDLIIGTDASMTTTSGNLEISGSVATDAFRDVTINSPLTTTGSVYVRANRDQNVNRAISSTGANSVSLFAGNTAAVGGTLNLAANVSSTGGDILAQAGLGNDCFADPFTSSVLQTAGTISTTGAGNISVNADASITLMSLASINAVSGNVYTVAGLNTNLTNTTITKTAAGGDLLMISGRDLVMTNSQIAAAPAFVTLVVDNCFPIAPLIGPGALIIDATSSINAANLRMFTALQSQNQINGTFNLNGNTFVAGTLFVDTATEHWCQYFALPFPYPLSNLGNAPLYTIFYKNCLQQVTYQAQIIVTQFLAVDLHPYNEYPGWMEEFWVRYQTSDPTITSSLKELENEPFYIRRRNLNVINHPKTYTLLVE